MQSHWKTGLAAIVTAGILVAGVNAQEGASGDITIKDKKTSVTQSTEPAVKDTKVVKPQIHHRDPFVNQLFSTDDTFISDPVGPGPRPKPQKPNNSPQKPESQPNTPDVADNPDETPEIPAPEVTINGIVTSASGNQAIISTGNGTRVISTGQKLGDYRVSSIGDDYVAFSYGQDKVFKVPMQNEF